MVVTVFWRRLDLAGLERMVLDVGDDRICARSSLLCVEGAGFRLDYEWLLDGDWQTCSLAVRSSGALGERAVRIDRAGDDWSIDGTIQADLHGAAEPDLSVTPFCNTLPIRRLGRDIGAERTLDTVYVDGADLSVTRSRQRYVRTALDVVRYVDLGTARGFEANLRLDADDLVVRYEGLFERVRTAT